MVALHQWALGTTNPDVVAPWLRKSYAGLYVVYALAIFGLARKLPSIRVRRNGYSVVSVPGNDGFSVRSALRRASIRFGQRDLS